MPFLVRLLVVSLPLLFACPLHPAAAREETGSIPGRDGAPAVVYAARIPAPAAKGPAPGLIVALHGINGNERQLLDACSLALQAAKREDAYIVLGLKSQGAGWESVDHAPIRNAVAWAIATHRADPRRVFAWGYSHGAIRLGHFAAEAQDLFAGAVLWAGTCHKPAADGSGIAYYAVTGERDPTVKPDQMRSARDRMRTAGVRLVYRELAGGDHGAPFSPPGRAIWADHVVWMDALRNRRQEQDARTVELLAKATAELDADGRLSAATAKSLFPVLLDAAGDPVEALLVRLLRAEAAALRRQAATVCARRLFGDAVIAALVPLLQDADREAQAQALAALGLAADLQVAAAQEALCAAVRDGRTPAQRSAAVQATMPALRSQAGTVAYDPPLAALLADLGRNPAPAMQKLLAELQPAAKR